jgi:hypothetical protein
MVIFAIRSSRLSGIVIWANATIAAAALFSVWRMGKFTGLAKRVHHTCPGCKRRGVQAEIQRTEAFSLWI